MEKRENAEIVILDPLYKLMESDENSAQDMKPILAEFDRITRETGAAVMYVHHDAKGSAGDRNIRDRGAGSGVLACDYDTCITLTAHRDEEDAAVCQPLLRNYPPQSEFVAEFWDGKFSVSDLPAVAETSQNARKKQEITHSDEEIIAVSGCSMTEFRNNLREQLGLTERNARKVVDEFLASGKLIKFNKPGTRLSWICAPGAQASWEDSWAMA